MAAQLFLPGALWPGMLLGSPGPQPLAMPDEAGAWLPGTLLAWPGAHPLAMPEEAGAWLPERREGAWLPAGSHSEGGDTAESWALCDWSAAAVRSPQPRQRPQQLSSACQARSA